MGDREAQDFLEKLALAPEFLDGEGRVDAAILNSRRESTILRNESPGDHHWIERHLRGTRTKKLPADGMLTVAQE